MPENAGQHITILQRKKTHAIRDVTLSKYYTRQDRYVRRPHHPVQWWCSSWLSSSSLAIVNVPLLGLMGNKANISNVRIKASSFQLARGMWGKGKTKNPLVQWEDKTHVGARHRKADCGVPWFFFPGNDSGLGTIPKTKTSAIERNRCVYACVLCVCVGGQAPLFLRGVYILVSGSFPH